MDKSRDFSQDGLLPIANISRIMRKGIPANGKISKGAKESVQECVSEFIIFVTSQANDKCQREKRITINGDDLLWAMARLGFEDYVEPLKAFLNIYREGDDAKRSPMGQDGSARKEEMLPDHNHNLLVTRGLYSQGQNHGNSQQQAQHLTVLLHGSE